MKRVTLALTLALAAGLSAEAADAQTLKTVKERGMLSCGVSQGLPGFSSPDDIFIHGDRLYVADTYNSRVVVFNLQGAYL